ncbi:MAG: serine/threonine protein kinase [Phycisphaerae bacterium]|nr:serine/threonine protein kinase [Phycisphaerae bacterium]
MHPSPDTARSPETPGAPAGTDHRDLIDRARRQAADARRRRDAWQDTSSDGSNAEWCELPIEPDLIAGYRLLDDVHRGGQGLVMRAIQVSTGRTVAVKVLGRGTFASPGERVRFEREIEILSSLSAPGIVRIIDRGEARGLWWFSMDFVDGVPLDEYARRLSLDDEGRREILALFVRVARAVHAAHLRGVIHRDLKPRNILVDADGAPHVVDFGLAKDLRSAATESAEGGFVGTLPWAAPEQVPGSTAHPDVRTDVYALGVVLYQALTERFPYRVIGPLHEVSEAIGRTPPAPPSVHDPALKGDLETIVLTCLQKDPARRYQSAAALAEDLERVLEGEPIQARRDSLGYLARRWMRTHRAATALALVAAALVVAFAVTTTALWRSASDARDRAESEARKSTAVLAFLEGALRAADPGGARAAGENLTMAEFAATAARELDDPHAVRDPETDAAIRMTLAETLAALGRFDDAKAQAERAYERRRGVLGDAHVDTAKSLVLLGSLERSGGNVELGRERAERGLRGIVAAHAGRDHDDAVEAWRAVAWQRNRARDQAGALAAMREAVAMRERLDGADAVSTLQLRLDLAILAHDAATIDDLRAIRTRLEERLGRGHRDVITATRMLSGMLVMRGDLDGAESLAREALDGFVATYGARHSLALDARLSLAGLRARRGDLDGSRRLLEDGLADARVAYGDPSHGLAQYLVAIGGSQWQAGNAELAQPSLEEALAMMRQVRSDASADGAKARVGLAGLALRAGDVAEAEKLATETVALEPALGGTPLWSTAEARCILGRVRLRAKAFADAERFLTEGFAALERFPAWAAPYRRDAARSLADLYEDWSRAEPSPDRTAAAAAWRARAEREASP